MFYGKRLKALEQRIVHLECSNDFYRKYYYPIGNGKRLDKLEQEVLDEASGVTLLEKVQHICKYLKITIKREPERIVVKNA